MTPEGFAELKVDEGNELSAYPDPESPLGKACAAAGLLMREYQKVANWKTLSGHPWTIAAGLTGPNIVQGLVWTQDQADTALKVRVAEIEAQLFRDEPWMTAISPVRQDVFTNIAFNVGVYGEEHWPSTLAHGRAGEWQAVAHDLLNEGKWDQEVGQRANRLAAAMLNNAWGGKITISIQKVA